MSPASGPSGAFLRVIVVPSLRFAVIVVSAVEEPHQIAIA
jgi:hypothetical protein